MKTKHDRWVAAFMANKIKQELDSYTNSDASVLSALFASCNSDSRELAYYCRALEKEMARLLKVADGCPSNVWQAKAFFEKIERLRQESLEAVKAREDAKDAEVIRFLAAAAADRTRDDAETEATTNSNEP